MLVLVGYVEGEFSFFEDICQRVFVSGCATGLVSKSGTDWVQDCALVLFQKEQLSYTPMPNGSMDFKKIGMEIFLFGNQRSR